MKVLEREPLDSIRLPTRMNPEKQESKEKEKEGKNVCGRNRHRAENVYRETCEGMLFNMPVIESSLENVSIIIIRLLYSRIKLQSTSKISSTKHLLNELVSIMLYYSSNIDIAFTIKLL